MNSRALIHLLISLVILAGVVGMYVFGYYQVMGESRRSAELEATIQSTVNGAVAAAETSDTLASLMQDEAAIKGYYVDLANIVSFLERLEGTGRSVGSTVEVVTVADKPGADGRIVLSARITGSFDAVLRTLGAIEYGPYDSRVVSLNVDTPPGGSAWTAVVGLSIAVNTPPK